MENTQTEELLLDSLRIDLQAQGYSDTVSDFFNTEWFPFWKLQLSWTKSPGQIGLSLNPVNTPVLKPFHWNAGRPILRSVRLHKNIYETEYNILRQRFTVSPLSVCASAEMELKRGPATLEIF